MINIHLHVRTVNFICHFIRANHEYFYNFQFRKKLWNKLFCWLSNADGFHFWVNEIFSDCCLSKYHSYCHRTDHSQRIFIQSWWHGLDSNFKHSIRREKFSWSIQIQSNATYWSSHWRISSTIKSFAISFWKKSLSWYCSCESWTILYHHQHAQVSWLHGIPWQNFILFLDILIWKLTNR